MIIVSCVWSFALASPARILLLSPTERLKFSGLPLSTDDTSKRLYVYLPERTPVPDAVPALIGDRDIRIVSSANYLERFQRECPGRVCVLAGDQNQTITHLLASVTVPCHTLALSPLVTTREQLPLLKEVIRQAELREVHVRDWMVHRFLPAHHFVRDLLQDISTFGPLLRGTPNDPCIEFEWTSNLRPEHGSLMPPSTDGILNGLPLLLDQALSLCFHGTSIHPDEARVLSARQWPLPMMEQTITDLYGGTLPDTWKRRVQQGLILIPANGTATVQLQDIHYRLTVLGDYDPWQTTEASERLQITIVGLHTKLVSEFVYGIDRRPCQQVTLIGRDAAHQKRLQQAAEIWCRRQRSRGGKILPGQETIIMFPHGKIEHEQAAQNSLNQFLRFSRSPHHADMSELDNLYMKSVITLQAMQMASQGLAQS